MSGLTDFDHGITAIDTGLIRPRFDASYLIVEDGRAAFVDTGTLHSVPRLLEGLAARDLEPGQVDYVLLTHVHLDHAGGAGGLMQALPNAKAVLHPRGARHMIDPSRLEASARAVYGDEEFDALYGAPVPVPEQRILVMEDGDSLRVGNRPLVFMDSPGHARHHFTVWDEQSRGWFTGDTFGISYRELDTENGAFIFPTTTPVQFDPEALIDSMDRMMERQPDNMYLTHFGRVTELQRLAEDMRAGVRQFAEWGERYDGTENRQQQIGTAMMQWLVGRAREHGVELGEDQLHGIFASDVELNTQGIEFWLDHGRKKE